MRILSEKLVKGKRRVTVELEDGEQLMGVHENEHYSLGEPLDDEIVRGHMLLDGERVYWCVGEQKWKKD